MQNVSGMVFVSVEKKDRHSTGLRLLLIHPGANTELSRLEQKQFKYNTKLHHPTCEIIPEKF